MSLTVVWLYSSKGIAIAFLHEGTVYWRSGKFLGRLDGKDVASHEYVGEIFSGNRLVRLRYRPLMSKSYEGEDFALAMTPPTPIEAIELPSEFQDL